MSVENYTGATALSIRLAFDAAAGAARRIMASMRRPRQPNPPCASDYSKPSKSQLKREHHALQDLGLELLELPQETLDALIPDERLLDALRELRRISAHSARNRQAQYIGKLLATQETGVLRAALELRRSGQEQDKRALREAEQWRERLLMDDRALADWSAGHPDTDRARLSRLIRDARQERATQGKGRAFRELYKLIRAALDEAR